MGLWRNGSASDSSPEGCEFESRWPHPFLFALLRVQLSVRLVCESFYFSPTQSRRGRRGAFCASPARRGDRGQHAGPAPRAGRRRDRRVGDDAPSPGAAPRRDAASQGGLRGTKRRAKKGSARAGRRRSAYPSQSSLARMPQPYTLHWGCRLPPRALSALHWAAGLASGIRGRRRGQDA